MFDFQPLKILGSLTFGLLNLQDCCLIVLSPLDCHKNCAMINPGREFSHNNIII